MALLQTLWAAFRASEVVKTGSGWVLFLRDHFSISYRFDDGVDASIFNLNGETSLAK